VCSAWPSPPTPSSTASSDVTKTGSAASRTDGSADICMRGHFAWEYKAPGKNLERVAVQ